MKQGKIGNKDPSKSIICPLLPAKLRRLSQELPPPIVKYFSLSEGVIFELYKAKNFNSGNHWVNKTLYRLVIESRASYYRYGDYPPIDVYDKKAVVYLVRAIYLDKGTNARVEEWLSLRFVPGKGKGSIEDLYSYICKNKLAEEWVKDKLFGGDKKFLNYIISISRLCGIPSYISLGDQAKDKEKSFKRDNCHTSVCFAILCAAVINECVKKGRKVKYFTAQIPEELVQGFLAFKKGDKKYTPSFDLASDILGIKNKSDLKLDRNKYAYKFPLYFLKMKDLVWFIRTLLKDELISENTLNYYLKNNEVINEIKEKDYISVQKLKGLGELLTVKGDIVGGKITGEKIRELASIIPDGPDLRIMEWEKWERSIKKILAESETLNI